MTKKSLDQGIEKAKAAYRVFGPVKQKTDHDFKLLDKSELPDFDFQNTRLSPKAIVYPQSQIMFEYSLDETSEDCRIMKEVENVASPMAVVGVRPCDALSFPIVRRNFDSPEYQDTYWIKAYEATTLWDLPAIPPAPPVSAPLPAPAHLERKAWIYCWLRTAIIFS